LECAPYKALFFWAADCFDACASAATRQRTSTPACHTATISVYIGIGITVTRTSIRITTSMIRTISWRQFDFHIAPFHHVVLVIGRCHMLEWVYGVCRDRAARYPNSIELNEDEDDKQTEGAMVKRLVFYFDLHVAWDSTINGKQYAQENNTQCRDHVTFTLFQLRNLK
jgi:hypothetical protein